MEAPRKPQCTGLEWTEALGPCAVAQTGLGPVEAWGPNGGVRAAKRSEEPPDSIISSEARLCRTERGGSGGVRAAKRSEEPPDSISSSEARLCRTERGGSGGVRAAKRSEEPPDSISSSEARLRRAERGGPGVFAQRSGA